MSEDLPASELWFRTAVLAAQDMARALGTEFVLQGESQAVPPPHESALSAYVSLQRGDFVALVGIRLSKEDMDAFATSFISANGSSTFSGSQSVADLMSDFANTIAGSVQQAMWSSGKTVTLGVPFFVSGCVRLFSLGLEQSQRLEWNHSTLEVIMQMRDIKAGQADPGQRATTQLLANALESQRVAEAFNRELIANAPFGITTVSGEGRVLSWNPTATRLLGYKEQDIKQTLITRYIGTLSGASTMSPFDSLVAGNGVGGLGSPVEVIGYHKNGHTVPLEVEVIVTRRHAEISFTAFFRDLSELKLAEEELEVLNAELVETSRRAGKAEVAGEVLHNVGNVLNSVFVSTRLVLERIKRSRVDILDRLSQLLCEKRDDLPSFFSNDPRAQSIPELTKELTAHFQSDQESLRSDVRAIQHHVEHIAAIIAAQRRHVGSSGLLERATITEVLEDALHIRAHGLAAFSIRVEKEYQCDERILLDRHLVMQILINLLKNAQEALVASRAGRPSLTLRTRKEDETYAIDIQDNGMGIPGDVLPRIFSHGFTTKRDGNGYGLYASKSAAVEMGGTLRCSSDGEGQGACFTLELVDRSRELQRDGGISDPPKPAPRSPRAA